MRGVLGGTVRRDGRNRGIAMALSSGTICASISVTGPKTPVAGRGVGGVFRHCCDTTGSKDDGVKVKLPLTGTVLRGRGTCLDIRSRGKCGIFLVGCLGWLSGFPGYRKSIAYRTWSRAYGKKGGAVRVLETRRLAGVCNGNGADIATIGSLSLSITRNRFITIINDSNDKGSALLRVLNNISRPARKGI